MYSFETRKGRILKIRFVYDLNCAAKSSPREVWVEFRRIYAEKSTSGAQSYCNTRQVKVGIMYSPFEELL